MVSAVGGVSRWRRVSCRDRVGTGPTFGSGRLVEAGQRGNDEAVSDSFVRVRWAAIGAAVAVALGAGGLAIANAANPAPNPVVNTIAPCRIMDTRAATRVGPRPVAIGAGEIYKISVWGAQGNCNIPTGTRGVIMNVTVTDPTAASYLTVWPSDKTRPLASNLNWVASQAPTPNQVTSALAADGTLDFFNNAGNVNVIVDIVAYLSDDAHTAFGPNGLTAVAYVDGLVTPPHFNFQYLSNGQTATVTNPAPGDFVVTFPGFALNTGVPFDQTIQITGSSGGQCGEYTSSIAPGSGDLGVSVFCYPPGSAVMTNYDFYITVTR